MSEWEGSEVEAVESVLNSDGTKCQGWKVEYESVTLH